MNDDELKYVCRTYACPVCHTMYPTIREAKECEQACIESVELEKERKADLDRRRKMLESVRLKATSISHLKQLIEETVLAAFDIELLDFRLKVQYSPTVSNSHSAPIVEHTNWEREAGYATSFPGFFGSISFIMKYKNDRRHVSGSSLFGRSGIVGIHTGSGGGGQDERYHYDVCLFMQDFPKLSEKYDELQDKQKSLHEADLNETDRTCRLIEADKKVGRYDTKIEYLLRDIETLQDKLKRVEELKYSHVNKHYRSELNEFHENIEADINELNLEFFGE